MIPELHEQNWFYLAEGHLNLVLTNKQGLSLRCRKVQPNAQTYQSPDVEKTFLFINTVVRNLVSPEFMPDVKLVELDEKIIKCFPDEVVDRIDVNQKYGLLMEDCSHLMSEDKIISLEIKQNEIQEINRGIDSHSSQQLTNFFQWSSCLQ